MSLNEFGVWINYEPFKNLGSSWDTQMIPYKWSLMGYHKRDIFKQKKNPLELGDNFQHWMLLELPTWCPS